MSKETDTQQTLLQVDSHANPSVLREREEEQTMIATSGMKLLGLLEKQNQGGLLEKMLKELLTSKKAWYSDRCKMIWKKRVSKSNVLLFQLQASVRGIKGNESGLLHTPTATEIGMRSPQAMEKRKKYRESIGRKTTPPGNLLEQLQMMMYPTPTAGCVEGGEQSNRVELTKNGGFILRKKNKPNSTFGAKLSDAMLYLNKLYPTPTARDHKDMGYQPTWKPCRSQKNILPRQILKNNKPGGKLNPEFVEFLMGYPLNWTKIERTE